MFAEYKDLILRACKEGSASHAKELKKRIGADVKANLKYVWTTLCCTCLRSDDGDFEWEAGAVNAETPTAWEQFTAAVWEIAKVIGGALCMEVALMLNALLLARHACEGFSASAMFGFDGELGDECEQVAIILGALLGLCRCKTNKLYLTRYFRHVSEWELPFDARASLDCVMLPVNNRGRPEQRALHPRHVHLDLWPVQRTEEVRRTAANGGDVLVGEARNHPYPSEAYLEVQWQRSRPCARDAQALEWDDVWEDATHLIVRPDGDTQNHLMTKPSYATGGLDRSWKMYLDCEHPYAKLDSFAACRFRVRAVTGFGLARRPLTSWSVERTVALPFVTRPRVLPVFAVNPQSQMRVVTRPEQQAQNLQDGTMAVITWLSTPFHTYRLEATDTFTREEDGGRHGAVEFTWGVLTPTPMRELSARPAPAVFTAADERAASLLFTSAQEAGNHLADLREAPVEPQSVGELLMTDRGSDGAVHASESTVLIKTDFQQSRSSLGVGRDGADARRVAKGQRAASSDLHRHQASTSRIDQRRAEDGVELRLDLTLFDLGGDAAACDTSHRSATATKAFRVVEPVAPGRPVPPQELPGPVFAPEDEGKYVSVGSAGERLGHAREGGFVVTRSRSARNQRGTSGLRMQAGFYEDQEEIFVRGGSWAGFAPGPAGVTQDFKVEAVEVDKDGLALSKGTVKLKPVRKDASGSTVGSEPSLNLRNPEGEPLTWSGERRALIACVDFEDLPLGGRPAPQPWYPPGGGRPLGPLAPSAVPQPAPPLPADSRFIPSPPSSPPSHRPPPVMMPQLSGMAPQISPRSPRSPSLESLSRPSLDSSFSEQPRPPPPPATRERGESQYVANRRASLARKQMPSPMPSIASSASQLPGIPSPSASVAPHIQRAFDAAQRGGVVDARQLREAVRSLGFEDAWSGTLDVLRRVDAEGGRPLALVEFARLVAELERAVSGAPQHRSAPNLSPSLSPPPLGGPPLPIGADVRRIGDDAVQWPQGFAAGDYAPLCALLQRDLGHHFAQMRQGAATIVARSIVLKRIPQSRNLAFRVWGHAAQPTGRDEDVALPSRIGGPHFGKAFRTGGGYSARRGGAAWALTGGRGEADGERGFVRIRDLANRGSAGVQRRADAGADNLRFGAVGLAARRGSTMLRDAFGGRSRR